MSFESPSPQRQEADADIASRLSALRDGQFIVKRNAYPERNIPERYESGWNLTNVFEKDGRTFVRIENVDSHKDMPAELLLSWQPINEEPAEETLPRVPEFEYVESIPVVEDSLGEVAVGQSIEVEAESSREQELSVDALRANERIMEVLGENGSASNALAQELLKAGDSPDLIRQALADKSSSSELRQNVTWVLSRRMADLLAEGGHFHERVQENSSTNLKAPNGNHGYDRDKYQSDEYVVLLALAKLDGSFDTTREKDYDDLPDDHAHQGQHRQASNELLESFVRENDAAQPEQLPTDDERLRGARRLMEELLNETINDVRGMDGYSDMLSQMSHSDTIDLYQVHESLGIMQHKLQTTVERIEDTAQGLRRLAMDDNGSPDRRTTETIEQAFTDLHRIKNLLEQDASDQIRMLLSKTDEAHYERHIQQDYRSSLRQRSQQLSEEIHMATSMLHRVEL